MIIPFSEYIIISVLNILVCILHAIPNSSEKYYDLTGALSFITAIIYSLIQNIKNISIDGILVSIMGIVWAFRLGLYLFYRILITGEDSRFLNLKTPRIKMFIPFFGQIIWLCVLLLPIINILRDKSAIVTKDDTKCDTIDVNKILRFIGYSLWLLGFTIEIMADFQKKIFIDKGLKMSEGFISSGLWSISRHPNYLGEIILWLGISLIAFSKSYNPIYFIAPIITYCILNYVSGINLIEPKTFQRLKDNKKYLKYLYNVPKLFPNLKYLLNI